MCAHLVPNISVYIIYPNITISISTTNHTYNIDLGRLGLPKSKKEGFTKQLEVF